MNDLHKSMTAGLEGLADLLKQKEINFMMYPPHYRAADGRRVSDVPFIAAHVPGASQIIHDGAGGYDVWSSDGSKMLSTNLTAEKAAKVVTMEYFAVKAARIKQQHPQMDLMDIMARLEAGYQRED
jgi:hypothetical protein